MAHSGRRGSTDSTTSTVSKVITNSTNSKTKVAIPGSLTFDNVESFVPASFYTNNHNNFSRNNNTFVPILLPNNNHQNHNNDFLSGSSYSGSSDSGSSDSNSESPNSESPNSESSNGVCNVFLESVSACCSSASTISLQGSSAVLGASLESGGETTNTVNDDNKSNKNYKIEDMIFDDDDSITLSAQKSNLYGILAPNIINKHKDKNYASDYEVMYKMLKKWKDEKSKDEKVYQASFLVGGLNDGNTGHMGLFHIVYKNDKFNIISLDTTMKSGDQPKLADQNSSSSKNPADNNIAVKNKNIIDINKVVLPEFIMQRTVVGCREAALDMYNFLQLPEGKEYIKSIINDIDQQAETVIKLNHIAPELTYLINDYNTLREHILSHKNNAKAMTIIKNQLEKNLSILNIHEPKTKTKTSTATDKEKFIKLKKEFERYKKHKNIDKILGLIEKNENNICFDGYKRRVLGTAFDPYTLHPSNINEATKVLSKKIVDWLSNALDKPVTSFVNKITGNQQREGSRKL